MESGTINIRTALRTMVSGKTTFKMVEAWNAGLMAVSFKGTMSKALKKARVYSNGPMEIATKATLLTTTLKVKVSPT